MLSKSNHQSNSGSWWRLTENFIKLSNRTHAFKTTLGGLLGSDFLYDSLAHQLLLKACRIAQNFGRRKLWWIWQFIANPPKFYPPKSCEVSWAQLNGERVLSTAKVFSTNFLAVPTPPKFSTAKVLCYMVSYSVHDFWWISKQSTDGGSWKPSNNSSRLCSGSNGSMVESLSRCRYSSK